MHEPFMQEAILLAQKAMQENEVPVGAIVVLDNTIIGRGYNQSIQLSDPTAHAEIIAMREAAKNIGNYRLNRAQLYVTLEPCTMCVGAMIHARIDKVIFGATDTKAGAVCGAFKHISHPKHVHFINYEADVMASSCKLLLLNFFEEKRKG